MTAEAGLAMDTSHTHTQVLPDGSACVMDPAGQTCWCPSPLSTEAKRKPGSRREVWEGAMLASSKEGVIVQPNLSLLCYLLTQVTLVKVLSISETRFPHSKPEIANPTSYTCGDER